MKRFLSWISGIFISHNTLNKGQNDMKKLLGENGKIEKEHQDIKDLLSESGKLRKNVDKILEMKKIEEAVKKEVDKQNIPVKDSINNIILFTEKYTKKEIEITMLERDNNALNEKVSKLERKIYELENKTINLKEVKVTENIELNSKLEQGDNNKLYKNLLQNSNLKKNEIIEMFKNNDIYADKNDNAIFPIKNETGQIVGAFELDIDCIEKPKFWKQGNLHRAEYLSNKVFESIETVREEELEEEYEQEL